MDYGHWTCDHFDPASYHGFVYEITNKITGEKYIGQKRLHKTIKRPPLKGRKNKRHVTKDSDWRTYTGSSKRLNEDIQKLGKENFHFDILFLCQSQWELSYTEYKQIITEDAIPKKTFYNEFLGKVGRPGEKDKEKYT